MAARFNVEIRPHDYPLTKVYLDLAAMEHHHFLAHDRPDIAIPYNLVYSVKTRDVIPLPATALFDSAAKGGYRIMPADIIAYWNAHAAAHQAPPQWWTSGCPLLRIPTTL